MNYYERHLGDYARDTGHLTILEHGAYCLLLDRYYATEAGIPAAQAHRLARARTPEEIAAVDAVLADFFELVDGVWINHRAKEEIVKASARIEAAKSNGKKGGRPRKEAKETQQKPSGFYVGYENETQQEPSEKLTKHQAPDTKVNPVPQAASTTEREEGATPISPPPLAGGSGELLDLIASDPITGRACELAGLLRKRGADLQASNPLVRQWAADGVTDAEALTALDLAESRRANSRKPQQAINAGLLNAILPDIRTRRPGGGARASPGQPRTLSEGRAAAAKAIFNPGPIGADDGHERRTIDVTPAAANGLGAKALR